MTERAAATGSRPVVGAGRLAGSLAAAEDETGGVIEVERLGGGLVELWVRLPHLAGTARPGQFAQLRAEVAGWPLLRRPFSVAWTEGDSCSFVLAPVGEGTARLASLRPGDRLQALGPLGRGFTLPPPGGSAICVAGGLGCAPFPLLLRALRDAGTESVLMLSGAASSDRLYPAERLARGWPAVSVWESTDDGSRGRRGRVTDLLETAASTIRDLHAGDPSLMPALYACGPNPMLAAVAGVALAPAALAPDVARAEATTGARAGAAPILEASLEAPMACGFGTCLGCALPVRGERGPAWALCCREGPVMPLAALDWEAVLALPPPHVA